MRSTEDFDFPYVDMEIDKNFNNEEAIKKYKETKDKELKNEIILNNIPLVLKIAKNYIIPSQLPIDDIISCGNIGLMNAIETYDIDCNTKFSTYAYNRITGDILNYITKEYGNGSRYFGFFIMKCRQYILKLYGDKNYEPDYQNLNEVLDIMIETWQVTLSLTISWSLPKFMSIASEMSSSHRILRCSLLLLPSIFPSIRDFPSESAVCIK